MKATEDIFRAYDIRGVYGSELDAEVGERVGLAFGNFLRKEHSSGKISIGCDARVSSPELQLAVSKGVSRAGFDVDIIGMVPIPVANYFTWKSNLNSEEYVAGVYITASHNPSDYNGFKAAIGKNVLSAKQIQDIEKIIKNKIIKFFFISSVYGVGVQCN